MAAPRNPRDCPIMSAAVEQARHMLPHPVRALTLLLEHGRPRPRARVAQAQMLRARARVPARASGHAAQRGISPR